MIDRAEAEGLRRWRAAGPAALAEAEARLAFHPRFPDAARALAQSMLAAGNADGALRGIFKDAGRYIGAMLAIYLHLTGGLTLPRLKAFCASSKLISPGRARALLFYLRYLGYVEPSPVRDSGKAVRYRPTARFLASWTTHLRAALDAVVVIEPAARIFRDRLDEPGVFETFARLQAGGLWETTSSNAMDGAHFRVFLHRHAGSQILFLLIAADETFPPRGPIPFSLAAASRRFGVSRIQIRRMLDAGAREGLLRWHAEGSVIFEEPGRAEIDKSYRGQLVHLLSATAALADEMPELLVGSNAQRQTARAAAE